jgi:hypothetical protein
MIQEVKAIMLRDLASLRQELEGYPDDASLWRVLPGTANPGGNLILHLAGNLRFFLGAQMGGIAYVRDRDREFTARNLSRRELLPELDAAVKAVDAALGSLDADILDREFPVLMGGRRLSVHQMLVTLVAHLGYHLGQVNYHRRVVAAEQPGE